MSTLTAEQEQLVLDHGYLASLISSNYFYENMDRNDLIQVGSIGLIKASKLFDASRVYKFSTLAAKCIKGELIRAISKKRVQALSLNVLLSNEEGYPERIDLIGDDSKAMDLVPLKMDLQNALSKLDEMERFIINHSFGLETGQPLTQLQIAKICDVHQVHISRLRKRALEKLRQELEGEIHLAK